MKFEYFDEWNCLTCETEEVFPNRQAAIEHMKLVHAYKPAPAYKNLVMHLDFDRGCWQSNYEWDFGSFRMLEMTGRRQTRRE